MNNKGYSIGDYQEGLTHQTILSHIESWTSGKTQLYP